MSLDGIMSSAQVGELMAKMRNPDIDFRYMALNDLLTELSKSNLIYGEHINGMLVESVLKTLEDPNGEVQNLGIKCLGPLVRRSKEGYVQVVVDKLCRTGTTAELKDISATALRTVILEVPATSPAAASITHRLVPRLLNQLQNEGGASENLLDSLDVLVELLNKFGRVVMVLQAKTQDMLVQTLSKLLDNSRPAVRKRAVVALGSLVLYLPVESFSTFMSATIETFAMAKTNHKIKTLISLIGQICKCEIQHSGPGRFADYLQVVAPIVIDALETDDDELRELALQGLEAFVLQGGHQIKRYEEQIMTAALRYLKYDPNYAIEDEENDEMADAEEDDESDLGSDFEDDAEYEDDDDISWKLRRCAAKLAAALIKTYGTGILGSGTELILSLISRFNDREENVRVEVLQTFVLLLQRLESESRRPASPSRKRMREDDEMDVETPTHARVTITDSMPRLVKVINKELDGKSIPAKQACFAILSRLIRYESPSLLRNLTRVVGYANTVLNSSSTTMNTSTTSALKISALELINALVHGIGSDTLAKHSDAFVAVIIEPLLNEKINKISLLALEVAQNLLSEHVIMRHAKAYTDVSNAVFAKLQLTDLEQDVRDAAIRTTGCCIVGDTTGPLSDIQRRACELLGEKTKQEATRLSSIMTIGSAVARCDNIDRCWLLSITHDIVKYVNNSNRVLRNASIATGTTLTEKIGAQLSEHDVKAICRELVPLLSVADAQLTMNALSWLKVLAETVQQKELVSELTLPTAYSLVPSAFIQSGGPSTTVLVQYFEAICSDNNYTAIVQQLCESNASTNNFAILCRFIVAVILRTSSRRPLDEFIAEIKSPKTHEDRRTLALYVLGEYGRQAILPESTIIELIQSQFNSPSEQVRNAAAFALGGVASCDIDSHLPLLLDHLNKPGSDTYLLVLAIKEMIVSAGDAQKASLLAKHADIICRQLLSIPFEERTNMILAESIGRLTLLRPQLLPGLRQEITTQSSSSKVVVIRAIRYTFTAASTKFDNQLRPFIVDFLSLMEDETLEVRRLALSTLYSAAHNKPYLIADHLNKLLPLLYQETTIRADLMHTVQMGPFKHIVDNGLQLRKNAFETLHTLLESFHENMDIFNVLDIILRGLDDVHEIKTLCFLMLTHLVTVCPDQTRQKLDAIAEKLQKLMSTKLKETAVKQDKEKDFELKRATLRCAMSLRPASAESTPGFNTFMEEMEATRGHDMYLLATTGTTTGNFEARQVQISI